VREVESSSAWEEGDPEKKKGLLKKNLKRTMDGRIRLEKISIEGRLASGGKSHRTAGESWEEGE